MRSEVSRRATRRILQALVSIHLALLGWPNGVATASDITLPSASEAGASPSAADSTLVQILADLARDTPLRVKVRTDGIVEGVLVEARTESLVVSPEVYEERSIGYGQIEVLWLHAGDHRRAGTRWGVLIGALVGSIALPLFVGTHVPLEGDASAAVLWCIPLGAAGGFAVGAGTGALVGRLTPAWGQQYPQLNDIGEHN